jgi:hypothetical protein
MDVALRRVNHRLEKSDTARRLLNIYQYFRKSHDRANLVIPTLTVYLVFLDFIYIVCIRELDYTLLGLIHVQSMILLCPSLVHIELHR